MNAQEYLQSFSAKERIEMLLSRNPIWTLKQDEIVENCKNIINKLDNLKFNHERTIREYEVLINSYSEPGRIIIKEILLTAFSIDESFHFIKSHLLQRSLNQSFNNIDPYEQIKWIYLDNDDLIESEVISKSDMGYPEYYYALCELILISLGKEKRLPSGTIKQHIMAYGKNKYRFKTRGEGFYDHYIAIDLDNMTKEVRSMDTKFRKNWKDIIAELSNHDADVIFWLKNRPT